MKVTTTSFMLLAIMFGALAHFLHVQAKLIVPLLVMWLLFSAAAVLWAFRIQREQPLLARACVWISLSQLALFFVILARELIQT